MCFILFNVDGALFNEALGFVFTFPIMSVERAEEEIGARAFGRYPGIPWTAMCAFGEIRTEVVLKWIVFPTP